MFRFALIKSGTSKITTQGTHWSVSPYYKFPISSFNSFWSTT